MVNFTGLVTSDFYSSGTIILDTPQKLVDRIELDTEGGTLDLPSLATGGLDAGEPNAAGYTQTLWYELPVSAETTEKVRVLLTTATGTSTAKVSAYTSSIADAGENIEPTYASLTLIQAASADQKIAVDPAWDSIYLQVGLISGDGLGFALTWSDADPLEGGAFATPYVIEEVDGYEVGDITNAWTETGEPIPVGVSAIRSIWFQWECPLSPPASISFRVTTTVAGDYGLAAYTGTAVNALVLVTSTVAVSTESALIEINAPVAGQIYYIQITSESAEGEYELEWFPPAGNVEPAELFDYISVKAYDKSGMVLITELKDRRGIQFQEPLNTPGMGTVSIPMKDESLVLNPLADGNVIKFWFGSKCVSGFRIHGIEHNMIADGEVSERFITASGPTVHQMMDDWVVVHEGGGLGNAFSKDERTFSWASGVFPGFAASLWRDKINANSLTNPPGGKPGDPPKKRPKWGYPKRWRDRKALWMWISQQRQMNENNWKPKRKILGRHYYRRNFTIKNASERVRIWSSSDDLHEIWLDGVKVIESNNREVGYKTYSTFNGNLKRGRHTVAAFVYDRGSAKSGDRNDSFLFSMATLYGNGKTKRTLARSNRRWWAWHGPRPPAWTRAKIFRQVKKEAKDVRGIDAAEWLGTNFSDTLDSAGRKWTENINMSFKIGTSALDLQSQLSESGRFDVWVNPQTMQINAYNRRGVDRSRNVALDLGYNLGAYSINSNNRVKNRILTQFAKGKLWVQFGGSIRKYGKREGYVELGGVRHASTARHIVQNAGRYVSESDTKAGSPDVIVKRINEPENALFGVEGAYPFLDFNVGDIISAPNSSGQMKKHRVISISCTESDVGIPTFDTDLEPWQQ